MTWYVRLQAQDLVRHQGTICDGWITTGCGQRFPAPSAVRADIPAGGVPAFDRCPDCLPEALKTPTGRR